MGEIILTNQIQEILNEKHDWPANETKMKIIENAEAT